MITTSPTRTPAERLAQTLTILSFVMLCWVAHRALETRPACLHSDFLSFVQVDGRRIPNCSLESRLSLRSLVEPVSNGQQEVLRALEVTAPLAQLLPRGRLRLAVDVAAHDPDLFELGKGYVRLGTNWLNDPAQLQRALTMGILRQEFPQTYTNHFQLEVVADFMLLAIFGKDEWKGEDGKFYSLMRDMRFSTMAPSFEQYCLSPFRSLSHRSVCHLDGLHDLENANVWGVRPLLAVSLYRVYEKLPLAGKMRVMDSLRAGRPLPELRDLNALNAESMVDWFRVTLNDHVQNWLGQQDEMAIKRTLKELEVESPTRWELTLDLTATPVWREILDQLKQRAQFRQKERVLVFTPEGAKALPSGLPVAWAADEISSQKHVLIACEWPKPEDTVHVKARNMFAHQSCTKLSRAFWD